MTNDFETHVHKAGDGIVMTSAERARMRARIAEYAAYMPVRVARARSWPLRRPALVVGSAATALLTATGGIALAAEGTLPGDTLYPVKIEVTEPLRVALAPTRQARVAVQTALAERRLDEATKLAEENRLSRAIEAALAANFAEHAQAVVAEEASTALAITTSDFTGRLAAHEHILAKIEAGRASGSGPSALRESIRAQITSASSSTAPLDTASTTAVAELRDAAQHALDGSAATLAKTRLTPLSGVYAENALEKAKKLNERGRELLEADDTRGAAHAFRSSLKAAAEIEVLVRAAGALRINTFTRATTTVKAETGALRVFTQTMAAPREESDRAQTLLEIELK